LRLPISTTLVQVAAANGQFEVLALTRSEVERWLKEWNVSDEEKSQFLKTIIDALTRAGKSDSAYEYRILLVHTLPSSSPESRSAAIDAIVAALRIPTVFDFDTLYSLDPIIAVRDHELFPLLQIFLKNGFPEFRAWADGHSAVLETHQLESSQLERKIRLVAFSSLAFDYIGRDLPYSTIASTLQIDTSKVEKWTIDVIRTGLISGKLSQATQNLHVYRSSARKFEREQWEALEKRLLAWKAGLASVIEIVAQAQRRGGNVAETVQATQNEQVENTA
jgi:translation initiation factor 3 subunit M